MMTRLTEREQIKSVAARWRLQYSNGAYQNKLDFQRKLDLLDVNKATAEDVTAIIGNSSWVQPKKCVECDKKRYDVIMLGEEPDYESSTICICPDCLQKALLFAEGKL